MAGGERLQSERPHLTSMQLADRRRLNQPSSNHMQPTRCRADKLAKPTTINRPPAAGAALALPSRRAALPAQVGAAQIGTAAG